MNNTGLIYICTSKTTNKSYIGKSINFEKRKKIHKNSAFNKTYNTYNTHFCRAIRKYGWNDFEWNILYAGISIEQLDNMEKWCIGIYDTYNNGYNSTTGGEGILGYRHTEDAKRKMKGQLHSESTKQKISKSVSGKNHPLYGKHHTEETKQKMRKPKSKETRKKMSLVRAGKEWKSKYWRIIKPDGNEEIIKNLSKYCKENDLHDGSMFKILKGQRNHCKGYKIKPMTDMEVRDYVGKIV